MMIMQSSDYDQFKMINFNRPVCKKNLGKLIKLNEQQNRFHLFPIVVDQEFNIIDGQHRFEACKELSSPVFYVTDYSCKDHWDTITEVNEAGKKHSAGDVYEMLLRDNDPYAEMIKTVQEIYPELTAGVLCVYFINNGTSGETVLSRMKKKTHSIKDFNRKLETLRAFIDNFGYFKNGHASSLNRMLSLANVIDCNSYLKMLTAKGFVPHKTWSVGTFKEELVKFHNKNKNKNKIAPF